MIRLLSVTPMGDLFYAEAAHQRSSDRFGIVHYGVAYDQLTAVSIAMRPRW